jgi:single-strand DNA-binding protein
MSESFNQATFTGNLGKDPDLHFTPQGTPICTFSIAVNNRKKVDGEWKDDVMWVKVKAWNRQAENASQYLQKGRPVLVTGRLSIEQWTGREGKEMTTLVLDSTGIKFLGDGGGARSEGQSERPRATTAPTPPPAQDIDTDDIPF